MSLSVLLFSLIHGFIKLKLSEQLVIPLSPALQWFYRAADRDTSKTASLPICFISSSLETIPNFPEHVSFAQKIWPGRSPIQTYFLKP